MRFMIVIGLAGLLTPCLWGQTARRAGTPFSTKQAKGAESGGGIETETIKIPESLQAPPTSMANQPGYMRPAQARELLTKIWQAESRVKDLLTQIHTTPEMRSGAGQASLNRNLDMLNRNLAALEESRQRFESRVDSEYLGFETYAGIAQVLPPLGALANRVLRYHDFSLAGEFNQSWNDMLTMQQALKPYLSFLLRNRDQAYLIMESNLYGCQNELNYAMHGARGPAQPMRNVLPAFKGRRRIPRTPELNVKSQKIKPQGTVETPSAPKQK